MGKRRSRWNYPNLGWIVNSYLTLFIAVERRVHLQQSEKFVQEGVCSWQKPKPLDSSIDTVVIRLSIKENLLLSIILLVIQLNDPHNL